MSAANSIYILRIDCPDAKGLVHKITGVLYHHDSNVIRNDEFVDRTTGHFFMRTEFSGNIQPDKILQGLRGLLPDNSTISLTTTQTKKVVILATKEHHCLSDLLIRNKFQDLNMDILAVISNHTLLQELTERFSVPFHFISHEHLSREDHETEVLKTIQLYQPDYVILAKYMRILTPAFTSQYTNRMINIHHSFLPAFIGANPYKQAFERGVKIIGATAHFVNEDLDEGPIIMQDVIHVDHSKTASDMAQAGHDVEKIVLAKALKLVLEDRVFIKGNKTIIFE
ncbi:formyltetrahydrofolate deformylase [Xanthocytophaga agilis]|uniref:Formyltetrahydrofolate deformylase n=1 Tax=Xanthocytophaga agilis TaxID=3048010 RepID=A0AAE3R0G7_9BACT|nr:formyltetrahydrofolate deformylase [Xanthocytophaga agilis]MDJ1499074.1 formyltetrahydrofolate deformylase [Xanthocytophaga agilis]